MAAAEQFTCSDEISHGGEAFKYKKWMLNWCRARWVLNSVQILQEMGWNRGTEMNSEELKQTLMEIYGEETGELTKAVEQWRRAAVFLVRSGWCSGQRWCSRRRSTAAAELGRLRHCEEEDEDEEARGEMKRTPIPIYKAVDGWHARESRRLKKWLCGYKDALIFGRSIKNKDMMRCSRFCLNLMRDDVMAG